MNVKSLALASAVFITALTTRGQGTVQFANNGTGVNAPVYLLDGVTKASGPDYTAELLAGPMAPNLSSLATTGFLTGSGAGYFDGGTVSIPTVPGGSFAFAQVRFWSTSAGSYSGAQATPGAVWGQSPIFQIFTGDPSVPTPPAQLSGLSSAGLMFVPEPSSVALSCLAVGALYLFRRR